MSEPKSVKTLASKLVEILADLGPVEKKGYNAHFKYHFVSEGQMMAELRGRLADRKILLLTSVDDCEWNNADTKTGLFVKVKTSHQFCDAETGETIMVRSAGVGWDSGDKGVYKAITGATKYALMKTFLVTDEANDPEASGAPTAGKPGRHKPTKAYEEETAEGDQKALADLLALSAYLKEHDIPEGFVVAILKEKKLVSPQLVKLSNAPPGVIQRTYASRERLLKAFQSSTANVGGDSKTNAGNGNGKPAKAERGPFDDPKPDPKWKVRQPVQQDISPADLLGQEGLDDWREVKIARGKQKGTALGKLTAKSLVWWIAEWTPEPHPKTHKWSAEDLLLDAGLCLAHAEMAATEAKGKIQ